MIGRSLTDLVPVPRTVKLGDRDFLVGELRIVDLAVLQGWLDEQEESPLDQIRDKLADLDEDSRKRLLADTAAKLERWPPRLGEQESSPYFNTAEGVCKILWLALRHYQPAFPVTEIVGIALALLPGQFDALKRCAFRVDALSEIEDMLGFAPDKKTSVDWPKAIDELAQSHGWTYEYIYTLTLSEFANARANGMLREHGISPLPGESMADLQARIRKQTLAD